MNGDVESVSEMPGVVSVDRTGRVSRPVCDRELSPSAIRREPVVGMTTLRGRYAHAHLPCKDNEEVKVTTGAPVPPSVPGDFTVVMGAVVSAATLRGLEEGMAGMGGAAGLLSWLEWVEMEIEGFDDLVEELHLLRGAVMSVAAAVAGGF